MSNKSMKIIMRYFVDGLICSTGELKLLAKIISMVIIYVTVIKISLETSKLNIRHKAGIG